MNRKALIFVLLVLALAAGRTDRSLDDRRSNWSAAAGDGGGRVLPRAPGHAHRPDGRAASGVSAKR